MFIQPPDGIDEFVENLGFDDAQLVNEDELFLLEEELRNGEILLIPENANIAQGFIINLRVLLHTVHVMTSIIYLFVVSTSTLLNELERRLANMKRANQQTEMLRAQLHNEFDRTTMLNDQLAHWRNNFGCFICGEQIRFILPCACRIRGACLHNRVNDGCPCCNENLPLIALCSER